MEAPEEQEEDDYQYSAADCGNCEHWQTKHVEIFIMSAICEIMDSIFFGEQPS